MSRSDFVTFYTIYCVRELISSSFPVTPNGSFGQYLWKTSKSVQNCGIEHGFLEKNQASSGKNMK